MTVLSVRVTESPRRTVRGAGRPDLRLPVARPRVTVLRGGRRPSACVVAKPVVPVVRRGSAWLLRLKVGAVAVLSLSAATMAAVHLAEPDVPAPSYVAGAPEWAHVVPNS